MDKTESTNKYDTNEVSERCTRNKEYGCLWIYRSRDYKSNILMIIFSIINCIIGSGIIALPYGAQKAGLPMSIILTSISAIITALTCYLLAVVSKKTGEVSYSKMVEKTLGRRSAIFHLICNVTLPVFLCIAYGIAIADNTTRVFSVMLPSLPILQNRSMILLIFLGAIVLPLCLPKHLALLGKVSMLSVFFILFYIGVFLYRTTELSKRILVLPDQWNFANAGIAQALGTLSLAFTAHHNILILFHTLRNNTIKRLSIAVYSSVAVSTILYYLVIFSGYLSFAGVISGNILNNYCVDDKLLIATRIIFTFSLIATYPLQVFSARETIMEKLKDKVKYTRLLRYGIGLVIVSICGIISSFVTDIGPTIEITGSLTAPPLIFIFPCLMYMRVTFQSFRYKCFVSLFMWVVVVFGVLLMIIGTCMSIFDAVTSTGIRETVQYWCNNVLLGIN